MNLKEVLKEEEKEEVCRKRNKSLEERGIKSSSTSGLPQQNICATSGKIPWNSRLPSSHLGPDFSFFFFFLTSSKSL